MKKLFQLEPFTEHGEPRVIVLNGTNHIKTASGTTKYASSAIEYVNNIEPEDGYTYVLVIAMSAGEFYGCNRNGDAFAEKPIPGIVEEGETLKDHYKTFEQYAKVYRHHINKDPTKAIGDVIKAFYNDKMHRVELLLKLDNEKAKDIVTRLNNGEYPAVSMGCKIKYDVCSRKGCHNKARTRAEYCQHAMFNMTKVDPHTGEQNFVWNPSPKLFDISFVIKPADKIGFTMKKVAGLAEPVVPSSTYAEEAELLQKSAEEFSKLSELDKYIRGFVTKIKPSKEMEHIKQEILPRVLNGMESMPEPVCKLFSKLPMGELISSLNSQGIHPTGKEIITITAYKFNVPKSVRIKIIRRSNMLSPASLNLFRFYPEIIPAFLNPDWLPTPNKINKTIVAVVKPLMEKRSNLKGYVYRRAVKPLTGEFFPDPAGTEHGKLQPLMFEANGERYVTTRGALEHAQDDALERNALLGLGSAAGSLGLYKLLTTHGVGAKLWPLMLGGSAILGKSVYDTFKTRKFDNSDIPLNTEVTKVSHDTSFLNKCIIIANEYNNGGQDISTSIKHANEELLNFSPTSDAGIFFKKLAVGINPRNQGHKIDMLIKESGLEDYPFSKNELEFDKISEIKTYLGRSIVDQ